MLILALMVAACVDPFRIEDTSPPDMLVVEGVFSNQLKRHQISLSRATKLGDKKVVPETGATVTISDQHGEIISLEEGAGGIYETPELSAAAGNTYTLKIRTSTGEEYSSAAVAFKDGPDIGDVYAEYINRDDPEKKGIAVYVDTEDPENNTHFYRWNYVETYEVHAPFPSNWVWLGGTDIEFRTEGIDTCYVTDTLSTVLLRNTKNLEQDKISGQVIRFIPAASYITRYRYNILVQQFCLSEESYLYWENLRLISEEQGSLADIQPGSLSGNIFSITNSSETVLGFFEVGRVSEKRLVFSAITFYNDGFKMPKNIRGECNTLEPIAVQQQDLEEAMRNHGHNMWIWEVYGMSPAITVQLMPKSCCDCRDLGPTERPPYF